MRILSIETSCDETAVALLDISGKLNKPEIKVLGNTLLSQVSIHAEYGGVYPMLAKREHQKNLPPLLMETLRQASEDPNNPNIDLVAVTTGPGLEPALWVGIAFAEELGKKWDKPVVPINHMEGHVFSVLYGREKEMELPALALLISGGHTELVHIKDFGNYEIIGRTLDDAVGEAFDKVARMLGLAYPGGPKISQLAALAREKGNISNIKFPRPMIGSDNLDFSFSGLKTAVLYKIKELGELDETLKENIAREFEDAVTDVLVTKTRKALENLSHIKTLIIAGGVSANTHLSTAFKKLVGEDYSEITLAIPGRELATDNALMIGIAAFIRVSVDNKLLEGQELLAADGNLSISSSQ
jgi:N6-L-threonylcarbamoyladenine synthase